MESTLEWVADYLDGRIKNEYCSPDLLARAIRENIRTLETVGAIQAAPKSPRRKRPTKLAVDREREAGRTAGMREASAANAVSRSRLAYLRRMLADSLRETTEVLWQDLSPDVPPDVGEELDRRALLLVQILQGVEREIGSVVDDLETLAGQTREPWEEPEERVE